MREQLCHYQLFPLLFVYLYPRYPFGIKNFSIENAALSDPEKIPEWFSFSGYEDQRLKIMLKRSSIFCFAVL